MKKSIIFIFLFGLMSCETIVKIDLPKSKPVIVVNSLFVPYTLPTPQEFKVELTNSVFILDTSNFKTIIPNAQIIMYEDNIIVDTLNYIDTAKYYVSSVLPFEGKKYKLEVSKKRFENVTCSNTVPEKVLIDTATVINFAGLDDEGEPLSEISLSFTDPANSENFYEIIISNIDSDDAYYLLSNDNVITSESYYPLTLMFDAKRPKFLPFKDIDFNGKKKELKIYYRPPHYIHIINNKETTYISSHLIDVHLRSITEEYYKFRTSFLQHLNNKRGDVLFGMNEPMNVYTNVTNGYGIFAAYQTNSVSLEVEGIQVP